MTFWRTLWQMVRFSRREYAIALIPQAFRLGMLFIPAFVVREIFNLLSDNAPLGWNYWSLVALVLALTLGRIGSLIGAVGLESLAALRSTSLLRANLFERWLLRPNAAALPMASGDAVNRMRTDVSNIAALPARAEQAFGGAVAGAIAFGAMVSINWQYATATLLPLVVSVIAVNALNRLREPALRAERTAHSSVSAFLGEVLGAVQAVQMAGAEERAARHLRSLNRIRQQAASEERVLMATLFDAFVGGAEQLGTALVLLLAAQSLQAGTFTVGDFVLFGYAAPIVVDTAFYAGALISELKNARIAFERLTDAASLSGAPASALVQTQPIELGVARGVTTLSSSSISHADTTIIEPLQSLDVRHLTFHYPGTGRGIEDVSFILRRGSFTVITGRIGAGKTTLLRVLLGVLTKDSGEVYWNGQRVDDPATFFTPPHSAYTPQVPRLFSDSLGENILLGLAEAHAETSLQTAIHAAVLEPDVAQLERGLDTLVGPRGAKLSGGQLQRAAAARMLIRQPELLVFDDLSSALDVETERVMWKQLCGERSKKLEVKSKNGTSDFSFSTSHFTILSVSHRRATLQLADQIVMMKDGRVHVVGGLDELLATCDEMRSIWEAQTKSR